VTNGVEQTWAMPSRSSESRRLFSALASFTLRLEFSAIRSSLCGFDDASDMPRAELRSWQTQNINQSVSEWVPVYNPNTVSTGSVEKTQRRHCRVSLKHDRTGRTEKIDLSGTEDGRRNCKNMREQTNVLKAKLWKLILTRTSDPNRPTRWAINNDN